jgi:hypothetical protein
MENESASTPPQADAEGEVKKDPEFKKFATKRLLVGLLVVVALIWGAAMVIDYLDKPSGKPLVVETHGDQPHPAPAKAEDAHTPAATDHGPAASRPAAEADHDAAAVSKQTATAGQAVKTPPAHGDAVPADEQAASHSAPAVPAVTGVAFADALIGPLNYELRERFWGWRPNDIINVTDNVNNIQLGVLEVTRRATIELTERISRTGSTASFDPHLERAMNWLMVKADEYWFPSAESKYKDAVDELTLYRDRLQRGEANFFTRADNLIPLLAAFEDLLGSCDENLVKQFEDDGEPVSHFMADDYFYYAKGVAIAMYPIMEAVAHDFHSTLQNRNGVDVIHHAIHSLSIAIEINPWYITEADLDGILANHRANIAAPISHARFYISVLINALST